MSKQKKIISFFFFIILIGIIQWLGHFFTMSSVKDWYLTLQKPTWNPPGYVFGPVWTILYLLIAISGWRIYVNGPSSGKKQIALIFYGLQLGFNLLWSFFFFFLQNPFLGMIDIFFLLIFIALTINAFYGLNKFAAFLMIPYFLWTLFAAILNFAIWSMNL